jgi:predicted TIM-barrel fold metal-dependent hydrolase
MDKNNYLDSGKCQYPHAPDVLERETSDRGFSQGWGMHFTPVEEYWTDSHTHLELQNIKDYNQALQQFKSAMDKSDIKYATVITLWQSRKEMGDGFQEILEHGISTIKETSGLFPMLYLDYKDADHSIIDEAVQAGVKGIKLHNAQVVSEGSDHQVWLSDEWGKVFEKICKYKLPVLWHVTQRLTDSPYTGGGRNTYWKNGWLKGVKYTNQDLLNVFLEVVGQNPDINFVGAHQLHMGWEQIAGLFGRYPNLLVDTSCGCIVREFDYICKTDINYLRRYFINYSDKILFGTDAIVGKDFTEHYADVNYANHIRFIRQLRLPYAELQRVAHGNFERLYVLDQK